MKKLLSLFFVLGLTLSACGMRQTQSAPLAQTATPSLVPTITQTPIPPTSTVTPLPTIPTFTPTFDVSTIVTVTPADKAECTKENPNILATNILPKGDNPNDEKFIGRIIEFLNNGGQVSLLNLELKKTNKFIGSYGSLGLTDITNDRVPELLIKLFRTYLVLKCDNGKYVMIYSLEQVFVGAQTEIEDLNQNSIPELIVSIDPCADRFCPENWILEWNRDGLETLLHVTGEIKSIVDMDGDGIREIIVTKGQ